jgi:hypothetical protein
VLWVLVFFSIFFKIQKENYVEPLILLLQKIRSENLTEITEEEVPEKNVQ